MKVITPTRGIETRFRVGRLDLGKDHHIVCHEDADRDRLIRRFGLSRSRVHCAHPDPGLGMGTIGWLRDWAQDNLTEDGEWYAMLDDNPDMTKLSEPWYSSDAIDFEVDGEWNTDWRSLYGTRMTADEALPVLRELRSKCEEWDTVFAGAAGQTNYFFRPKKWRPWTYIRAKFCVTKNIGLRWVFDDNILLISDTIRSAEVILRYGRVVVNGYICSAAPECEPGGVGSTLERQDAFAHTYSWALSRYSPLLKPCNLEKCHVSLSLRSQRSVDEWRSSKGVVVPECTQ